MHERLKYPAILRVDKSNTAPSGGAVQGGSEWVELEVR